MRFAVQAVQRGARARRTAPRGERRAGSSSAAYAAVGCGAAAGSFSRVGICAPVGCEGGEEQPSVRAIVAGSYGIVAGSQKNAQ